MAQQAALAQVEQTLPPLQKQLAQQRDLLAALIGGFPSDRIAGEIRARRIAAAARSAGQPAVEARRAASGYPRRRSQSAIGQRPDRRRHRQPAAEHHADRQYRLHRAVGRSTVHAGLRLLGRDRRRHPAAVSRRHLAAQGARREGGLQSGGGAVSQHGASSRFRTSPTSLRAIQTDAVALQKAVASEAAAAQQPRHHPPAPRSSATSIISALLNAQQTYQQALLSLAQAKAARYADTVALFQALGGGWWNRNERRSGKAPVDNRRLSVSPVA